MTNYLYDRTDWPNFRWDEEAIAIPLESVRTRRDLLLAAMAELGFELEQETILNALTTDVTSSSEIEGVILNTEKVRSSIAQRLGLEIAGLPEPTRDVEGVVEMMLDATQRFRQPLTRERLWDWHAALFPTGRSGMHKINVGAWRDDAEGPMQVVSGPFGSERVHYEAPPAHRVNQEMSRLLQWFENEPCDPIVKSAIAHLWFELIHPFDDGNGRIGRAIMDLSLARSDRTEKRFYSMSAQILKEKKAYYLMLEQTQRASMDVTIWIGWFLDQLSNALDSTNSILNLVERKRAFWAKHVSVPLNERQAMIVNRLLDGFLGKMKTAKYATIAKTSPDTALRDLTDLVQKGLLKVDEKGGRSTSYSLVEP